MRVLQTNTETKDLKRSIIFSRKRVITLGWCEMGQENIRAKTFIVRIFNTELDL